MPWLCDHKLSFAPMPVEIARGVDQERLGHRGAGSGETAVDEILPHQRAGAGDNRSGVAGAGGFGIKLLVEREEIIRVAGRSAARQCAHAQGIETR